MKEFQLIRNWASERGIYDKGDLKTQFIKLTEELGELSEAILKEDQDELIDAVGDMIVVLTNLCYLSNSVFEKAIDIEHCIQSAYDVIKNRKGKMKNGTFVKEQKKEPGIAVEKDSYFELVCKWSEISDYLKTVDGVKLSPLLILTNDEVYSLSRPSKFENGKAWIAKSDVLS